MDIDAAFDDDLARRLPLPLAQLYRRAHNAKGPRDRHDTAYCLWEAALKLLGATAVVIPPLIHLLNRRPPAPWLSWSSAEPRSLILECPAEPPRHRCWRPRERRPR